MNYRVDRIGHKKNRLQHRDNIQWLKDAYRLTGMKKFTGYAILLELSRDRSELLCVKVRGGVESPFLTEP